MFPVLFRVVRLLLIGLYLKNNQKGVYCSICLYLTITLCLDGGKGEGSQKWQRREYLSFVCLGGKGVEGFPFPLGHRFFPPKLGGNGGVTREKNYI